jgi:hypothetical protein
MNSILPAMLAPSGRCSPADAGQDVQVDAAGVQLVFQQDEQFLHRPGDPVGLVDHQDVARSQSAQRGLQFRAGIAGAAGLDHDLAAVRGGQGIELGLVVQRPGADPGVADPEAVVEDGRDAYGPIIARLSAVFASQAPRDGSRTRT